MILQKAMAKSLLLACGFAGLCLQGCGVDPGMKKDISREKDKNRETQTQLNLQELARTEAADNMFYHEGKIWTLITVFSSDYDYALNKCELVGFDLPTTTEINLLPTAASGNYGNGQEYKELNLQELALAKKSADEPSASALSTDEGPSSPEPKKAEKEKEDKRHKTVCIFREGLQLQLTPGS